MLDIPIREARFLPKRTFGVEMEWVQTPSRQVMKSVVNRFEGETAVTAGYQHNHNNEQWFCKTDSSCGYELASRVLGSFGSVAKCVEDIKRVTEVHAALVQRGFRTNTSCGTHIHIGVGDLDEEKRVKLLRYWVKLEKFFIDLVPHSRKGNRYCPPVSGSFQAHCDYDTTTIRESIHGRSAMNPGGWSHGTFEIRLFEGTMDPRNIKNMCRLVLQMAQVVRTSPVPENLHWFTLEEALAHLGLLNLGDREFLVLSPALSELRHWILARTAAYANCRDAEKVRRQATDLQRELYPKLYGVD